MQTCKLQEAQSTAVTADDTLQAQLEKQKQQIDYLMLKLQEAQSSQGGFSPSMSQAQSSQGGCSPSISPAAEEDLSKDITADIGTHIYGTTMGASKGSKMVKPKISTDTICEIASPELLPYFNVEAVDENTTQQLVICAHLHHLLTLWNQGGCQPVTFGDLKAHSLAGEHSAAFMKLLLGTQLWDGWFGLVENMLSDEDFIPRQALLFVHLALQKISFAVELLAEQQAAARTAYEDMQKKRRVLPGA